jgi:hypothetical protein
MPVDYDVEPDSSFINRIAYDAVHQRCYVTMHDTTYEYDHVPYDDFVELWSASSVGSQYQQFRIEYGPATLSGVTGRNIDFELRNHDVNQFITMIFLSVIPIRLQRVTKFSRRNWRGMTLSISAHLRWNLRHVKAITVPISSLIMPGSSKNIFGTADGRS